MGPGRMSQYADMLEPVAWKSGARPVLRGRRRRNALPLPDWKPIFYLLEEDLECWLLNARHMKAVPGRKTEVKDAQWIAQLVEHGLVRASFVPPEPIRQLRDLTRYRTEVIRERTREAQRLEKLLEDAGIKLSSVVSNILGVSGRAMLKALISGERDPQVLAEMAKGVMRRKTGTLIEALTGNFGDHHAFLARTMLDRIDACTATETRLSEHIDHQIGPFRRRIELLTTIPGISSRVAEVILAEIGADIARFPSPGDLASWAGVCPGNHESVGKQPTGQTRQGDPWPKGHSVRPRCPPPAPRTPTSPPVTDASPPAAARSAPWSPWNTPSSSASGTCSPTTSSTPISAAPTSSTAPAGPDRPDGW